MQQEVSIYETTVAQPAPPPPLHKSRSAERVLALLDAVVIEGTLSLTAAAARTGMPASTALRHLRVLTDRGYLVKNDMGTYSVGTSFLRAALASLQSGPYARLIAAAQPQLENLVEVTEESAYLAVRDGDEAVYIATVEGRRAIRHVGWVGRSVPIDGTAVGEALLSEPPARGARPAALFNTGAIEPDVTAVWRAGLRRVRPGGGPVGAGPGRPSGRPPPRDGRRRGGRCGRGDVVRPLTGGHGPGAGTRGAGVTVQLHGAGVSVADVVAVARHGEELRLSDAAAARMAASRDVVETLVEGEPVYGISTGFGALANTAIPAGRRAALQQSLIRSHAAGLGPPVEVEVVRAMMMLRARTLAFGLSGARPTVAESLVRLINAGIVPVVPEHGSLGASGDLAPLAHAALVLMGEGEVMDGSATRDAAAALAEAGIEPLELVEKEGLALTNGTDGILGTLCLAVHDARRLLTVADIVAGCSVEALLATDRAFAADLVALRPHPGQQASAANLRAVLEDSPIVASHRTDDDRVQDAYSVRCTPQVHGAARDTLDFAVSTTDRELASAIDNPMVLPDGRVESCGNFHGAPVALAADYLAIAAAEVGAVAERRIDRLLDPGRSHGLPPFLADDPGVDSGLMIGQYTAAALCAENRRLAAPASVDSLPTSAMQEDHVSMGWGAARKLRRVIANLRRILAVEWVAAARGVELRAPLQPAAGTGAAVSLLRDRVPGPGPDRWLSPELAAAEQLLADEALVPAVEAVSGPLA